MQNNNFGDWRLIVFWAVIAVAAGIAGFTLGWMWRDRPDALSGVSILSAMTAFGTVGAVVVALVATAIARLETFKHTQRSREILESAIGPELIALSGRLRGVRILLDKLRRVETGHPLPLVDRNTLAWAAKDIQAPFCSAALDKLSHLPRENANAIAGLVGLTPTLQSQLLWLSTVDSIPMDDEFHLLIGSYLANCDEIGSLLSRSGCVPQRREIEPTAPPT